MSTTTEESIELHCQEGKADKVYQVRLIDKGNGFVLHAANGRRGGTLTSQVKIADPVPYEVAKKAYDKLVTEKTRKGYRPTGESTEAFADPSGRADTGVRCQRLDPISEEHAKSLFNDPDWVLQEKHDGKRVALIINNGEVTACNLMGLECGLPKSIKERASHFDIDCTLDGELVGETFHAFDLIEQNGLSQAKHPYYTRLTRMELLLKAEASPENIVPVLTTREHKQAMFDDIRARNGEGVVLKRMSAPINIGKGHGDQLKFKFYETATVVVLTVNQKRSVEMGVLDNGVMTRVGNVTIPANQDIPSAGTTVEVRYLYAYPQGSLFQPIYLGQRDDIPHEECTTDQLKYKAGTA